MPDLDRIDRATERLRRTVRRLAVREDDPRIPPYLEHVDGKVRFIPDDAGRIFTVWDTVYDGRRHQPVTSGSPKASHRIFVSPAGARHIYTFRPHELRAVKSGHMERQLREATVTLPMRVAPPEMFIPASTPTE